MHRGPLYCTTTRTDGLAVYSPRMHSDWTHQQLAWKCRPGSPLYEKVTQEFEALWQANAPAVAGPTPGGE